ncbi:MAG: phosphatase PAP2 family protein [Polyangiales bacterium]
MSSREDQRRRSEPAPFPTAWQVSSCGMALVCLASCFDAPTAHADDEQDSSAPRRQEATFHLEYEPVAEPEADRPHRLEWHYKRVHWAEGVTAGVLGVTAIAVEFSPIDVEAHWTRTNAFDDWFQRRLTAPSDKQQRYGKASHALVATSIAVPVLVDLVGMTLIADRNKDVGLQMFAIQAQAFAITGFVTSLVKLSGRQRPCVQSADSSSGDANCDDPNQSYFSGHTSLAFAAAGLTCVEHQHFDFFGRVGDPFACAGALALATTAGVFRVVANRHWMSDVLTGAGVGLVAGWLMPWLMHYRHDLTKRARSRTRHLHYLAPYGDAGSVGLSAAGAF